MSKDIYINTVEISAGLLNDTRNKLIAAASTLRLIRSCPIYRNAEGHANLYPDEVTSEIVNLSNKLDKVLEKAYSYARLLDDAPDAIVAIDKAQAKLSLWDYWLQIDFVTQNPSLFFAQMFTDLVPGEITTVLSDIWTEIKQRLKLMGFSEDMIEMLTQEEFDDKPGFYSFLGILSKVEKIMNLDPQSWDSASEAGEDIIDVLEVILKWGGLEDWIKKIMGIGGADAGILVDLSVADLSNCVENTEESFYMVLDLIQDPDATFIDYLNAYSEIRYKLSDGILLEGFLDVVFEKADIIGSVFGLDDYMLEQSGGKYSTTKDAYAEFWEFLQEDPKAVLSSLWDTLKEHMIGHKLRITVTQSALFL